LRDFMTNNTFVTVAPSIVLRYSLAADVPSGDDRIALDTGAACHAVRFLREEN
jgi:hypothetical protein